jgi:nitrogenase-stabilizing/protective protein
MSSFLDQMASLSTAEDFFTALDVPFDQPVLHVKRLHILKHFHEKLAALELTGLDDAAQAQAYAGALAAAYADAQSVAPQEAGLFKVFHQCAPAPPGRAFVPLESITR